MLRVPPVSGPDSAAPRVAVMPEVSADSARQSRLRDAVWMLDTEVALNDGLTGVAEQVVNRAPANDVSRQFDADAGRLVEQLFGSVPEDVSEGARKFARENADSVLGSATAAWHDGDAAAGPGTALQALQKNLLGLFRGGRSAGADADSLTGEALSRIELLRGALPDEVLGSLGKWSRGMAAAADLDSALTRGDAARAEQALAGKALADSLPEEARREFARRTAIVRQRSKAAEIRQTLRAGVEAFGEAGGGGEKLDAAVEKAAASTRIRDADERAAFGWSLRQDLARTRAIKQARGLAVERSFRSSLKDGSADPEALFGLLDRAEQEGLLDDARLTLLRREQATALERRTLEWRETVEGAALLRDPSGFDRTNTVHRRQVDLWWKKTLEQLTPADLQPDAAEQGIFADLRSEDEQRLPGLDDDPLAVARDIVPRIGYLPKPLRGQILTVWHTGDAAALAPLAELTADLLGESPAALDDLPPATTAGLLLTAAWVRGGARPDKALETARSAVAGDITADADLSAALELLLPDEAAADDPILAASRQKLAQVADSLGVAGNSPARPAAGSGPAEAPAPRAVRAESAASGGDRLHGGAGNDALDGSYRYGDPDRKAKTGAKLDEISKLPPQSRPLDISDEDGKAVIRDPETGDVLGEAGFRTVDAIEALLAGAGLDKDFDRLTEDEKQALIDAAGMIPGLGEGISALQAYEAALQAKAAWERGDFGEAAGNAALALLDGAGAVPLVGKAAKLVRLFGGFIARNARKPGRQADAITPDTGLAMATAGGAGNPVRGNRPSGQPDDPGRRDEQSPTGETEPRGNDHQTDQLPDPVGGSDPDLRDRLYELSSGSARLDPAKPKDRRKLKKHAESIDELRAYADELYDANPTREQLGELADIAYDPAIKGFRAHEARQAKRLERQLGAKLERSKDAGYDLYDPSTGMKYDLKGAPKGQKSVWTPEYAVSRISKSAVGKPDIVFAIDAENWSGKDLDRFNNLLSQHGNIDLSKVFILK